MRAHKEQTQAMIDLVANHQGPAGLRLTNGQADRLLDFLISCRACLPSKAAVVADAERNKLRQRQKRGAARGN